MKFSWQEGFGAFSYSKSQISNVCNYIETQEEHHRKRTFTEEYIDFLEKFGIEYDKRYIFKPIDYHNGTSLWDVFDHITALFYRAAFPTGKRITPLEFKAQ